MSGLTFVTAYISIYDNNPPMQRTDEWRIGNFKKMAETGIQLCVYVSPNYHDALLELAKEFTNVKVMDPINLEDTYIAKACEEYNLAHPDSPLTLPASRNLEKDTIKYLQLQNCKPWFVQDALSKNPWNSSHFAWIDFNIAYIFRDLKRCQTQLKILANGFTNSNQDLFINPGCWGQWDVNRHDHHMDNIHWRFCGGFFMADKQSMSKFCDEVQVRFPEFLNITGKLLWEVNFWVWLEFACDKSVWSPRWYEADHNDRMLQIPNDILCQKVAAVSSTKYPYPHIEHFRPSSTSYVFYQGKHWLNTRFVSYFLTPQSYYVYSDGTNIIRNKNMIVELDRANNSELGKYSPKMETFMVMDQETIALPALQPDGFSKGLEDLRLYVGIDGEVKFIGTSVEHSTTGRGQMVVGNYDPYTAKYSNCRRVNSPNPDGWEKNWIPIMRPASMDNDGSTVNGTNILEEWFIYKWSPMELGKLVEKDGELYLEIMERHDTSHLPWFDRFRGSTTFMNAHANAHTSTSTNAEGRDIKGLVHFSEEGSPRHYYHSLVELDSKTLKPIRYSAPFYFKNIGVEFCTAMTVNDDNTYTFWISQMDRDPLMIVVDQASIVMNDC